MTAKITPIHKGNSKTELNNYTDPSQYSAPTPKVAFGVLYKCMARGKLSKLSENCLFQQTISNLNEKKITCKK